MEKRVPKTSAVLSWVNHRLLGDLGREWQLDPERRSPANLRSKVYRTVVKLHNAERAGQSDSAASRPGGEKQLEDFLLVFRRDAFAGVADGDFRHFTASAQHQAQLTAVRHGFRGVEHEIEHRLLEQSAIDVNFRDVYRQKLS